MVKALQFEQALRQAEQGQVRIKVNSLLPGNSTFVGMTFIRRLFQGLVSIVEKFTVDDACALLCAAGINNFGLDKLLAKDEEAQEAAASQDVSLEDALCLEAEYPAWSWKSETLSASFLWKKEADLNVRDWIYLV